MNLFKTSFDTFVLIHLLLLLSDPYNHIYSIPLYQLHRKWRSKPVSTTLTTLSSTFLDKSVDHAKKSFKRILKPTITRQQDDHSSTQNENDIIHTDSIKDLYNKAKTDPSFVKTAIFLVNEILAQKRQLLMSADTTTYSSPFSSPSSSSLSSLSIADAIQSKKELMNIINIYKLAGDLSGTIRLLHMISSSSSPSTRSLLDTAVFNNIIDLCAKQGKISMAMELIKIMESLSIELDIKTYGSILNACANSQNNSTMIPYYSQAIKLIQAMLQKNITPDTICFSSAILACARAGKMKESLSLLELMKRFHIKLDTIVYNTVISGCRPGTGNDDDCWRSYSLAKEIIATMRSEGILRDAYTYTAAIYALQPIDVAASPSTSSSTKTSSSSSPSSSSSSRASLVMSLLEEMTTDGVTDSVVPYNAALHILSTPTRAKECLKLYNTLVSRNILPNGLTYAYVIPTLLKESCCSSSSSSTVDEYSKLIIELTRDMQYIHNLELTPSIYKAVIIACERRAQHAEAWRYFTCMKEAGWQPSTAIYNSVMTSVSYCGLSVAGGAGEGTGTGTAHTQLVRGYKASRVLFDEMASMGVQRNSVTFNNLIASCSLSRLPKTVALNGTANVSNEMNGGFEVALALLNEMKRLADPASSVDIDGIITATGDRSGTSNVTGSNQLASDKTSPITIGVDLGVQPDTVSYSACISLCIESRQWEVAIDLLREMESRHIVPNIVT